MSDQIEIPDSFPAPGAVTGKRVVLTGAEPWAGEASGSRLFERWRPGGPGGPHRAGSQGVADGAPGPSLVLGGDVTDEDFNEAIADAAVAEWGGLDVWICNAGISPVVAGPRETGVEIWRQVLEVNLTGAFLGARAAARVMGEGWPADLHRFGH